MENLIFENRNLFFVILLILTIWDLIWRTTAMWKAANKKQLAWFICLAVFNTVGILPIIYLIINKKEKL